jgi:hypothetical protein
LSLFGYIHQSTMKLSYVAAAALAGVANAIPTITATGNKFFTSEGKQFFMKGMRIRPPFG